MEAKPKNIFEKLFEISNRLNKVAKNLEVGYGNNKYKAVSEADILKSIKPLEQEFKVYSYPMSRRVIDSGTIEIINSKGEVKKNLFERIETVYRFVNIENPFEYVDMVSYGDGVDSQDKSVGKAMTYADKYALMKAYKIETGDDPDQSPSEDLKSANILNQDLLKQARQLNMKLDRVAKYYEKDVESLTNEDLQKAIDKKQEMLAESKREQNDTSGNVI